MKAQHGSRALKFIPLGGVEDINRNCYVIEYGKDIVVIDMGLSMSEESLYGIDYLIPDVDYLKRRKDRIAGIVLSHAHLDHIGAIPYVIKELGFPPIYCREFTGLFLREKLEEFGLNAKVRIKTVEPNKEFKLGSLSGKLIPVTHSIPQSSSVLIKSQIGTVFYSGDFKFDDDPIKEAKPDYPAFEQAGKQGIDLACLDSTNIYNEGKAKSETEIYHILERIVKNAKGRVIAATFSSLATRLYSFIDLAEKYHRKIVISGRSMKNMIALLRKIGYLKFPENIMLSDKKINSVPDKDLLVLTTGSQGEEEAALARMARGEHLKIKIKPDDTIILSSSVIPGNQVPVQHLIDDLVRLGAKVIHQSFMDVHTSGHGYQEDIKKMVELIKPRFVMPVHGWPSFLHESAYMLNKWGIKQKNILIPQTGQVFYLREKGGKWEMGEKIKMKDIYVEGHTVGESVRDLVDERMQLANSGIVLVSIALNKEFQLMGEPSIVTRGVLDLKQNANFIKELKNIVRDHVHALGKHRKAALIKESVAKTLSRIILKETDKRPIIAVEVIC